MNTNIVSGPASSDDFGRPFQAITKQIAEKAVGSPLALLKRLRRSMPEFGRPRAGDPTPALLLLSIDGLYTDWLADEATRGEAPERLFAELLSCP